MTKARLQLVRNRASAASAVRALRASPRQDGGNAPAFDAPADAILEIQHTGRIVRASGRTEVLLGRTAAELHDLDKDVWVAQSHHAAFDLLVVAAAQARVSGELLIQLPSGRQRLVEVAFVQSRFAGTPVLRLVVRGRTRQSLEVALAHSEEVAREADRLATIGQLITGIAHELRTPLAYLRSNLNSVEGYVGDLREAYEAPERAAEPPETLARDLRQLVVESQQGIQRIGELVQALQGTARQQEDESFDPARSIAEAVTIFRGARRGECEVLCEVEQLPALRGSSGGLGQVVLNLLQNGLDAMGGRGKLEVKARHSGSAVEIEVRDHGSGIPLELHNTIFEPFFTTKPVGKGTGLGLPICRRIIEDMGGELQFETSGAGTVFRVTLRADA